MSVRPTTTDELAEALAGFHDAGDPVRVEGGGSHGCVGTPADTDVAVVSTAGISGLVFHEPADMVVAFKAGTPLAEVQDIAETHRQRLDIDPAYDESTIGGCIATDHYGPHCHGWGMFYDRIIGMTYVLADGRVIKAGGRVVKNVAGYDLIKLMIGSLGTLGVISEVILRLNPIGDEQRVWVFEMPDIDAAWAAAAGINASQLEPNVLCILDRAAAAHILKTDTGTCVLLVSAEGVREFIEYHATALAKLAGVACAAVFDGDTSRQLWQDWGNRWPRPGATPILARIGCRSSRMSAHLSLLSQQAGLILYPGCGVAQVLCRDAAALEGVRTALAGDNGYAYAWWTELELSGDQVWGPPRGDAKLTRQLKQLHDPRQILNAGRFYAGI